MGLALDLFCYAILSLDGGTCAYLSSCVLILVGFSCLELLFDVFLKFGEQRFSEPVANDEFPSIATITHCCLPFKDIRPEVVGISQIQAGCAVGSILTPLSNIHVGFALSER